MSEIFFSYAHEDNDTRSQPTHDHMPVVDYFVDLYQRLRRERGREEAKLFLDQASIPPGSPLPAEIQDGLESCTAMIAFYSPAYFKSDYCRREYWTFKEAQLRAEPESGVRKLLIPVEAAPVNAADYAHLDDEIRDWVNDLTTGEGTRRLVDSEALRALDNHELCRAISLMDDRLEPLLAVARRNKNTFAFTEKIRDGSMNTPQFQKSFEAFDNARRKIHPLPILVIYTGGTVGMVRDTTSSHLEASFRITNTVQDVADEMRIRLTNFRYDCYFVGLDETIDSANITSNHWVSLARVIAEQMDKYEGFVILHGTNTLTYTASALSFLLLDVITKPVILTGAEVPLQSTNTDAYNNIANAVLAAALQAPGVPGGRIPEVCVYWNGQLLRGNRTTKLHASDRILNFASPNMDTALAKLEKERYRLAHYELPWRRAREAHAEIAEIPSLENIRVEVLYIYPQLNVKGLDAYYEAGLDGLVLMSYGPGNAPNNPAFTALIRDLVSRGTVVINVTQCAFGRVELQLYETSSTLCDIGVIDGYDMTLEAAYCKLLWAISRARAFEGLDRVGAVRRDIQLNQAGEMTADIEVVDFGGSSDLSPTDQGLESPTRVTEVNPLRDIDEAILRFDDLRFFSPYRPASLTITLCSPGGDPSPPFTATFDRANDGSEMEHFNLRVTESFRDWYDRSDHYLRIQASSGGEVTFTAVRLTLYSMRPYLGMREPRMTPQFSEASS